MRTRVIKVEYVGRAGVALSCALVMALVLAPLQTVSVRAQNASADGQQIPDPYKLNMLIRTTLIALNQANRTGNYTVLRDLASPAFARTNDAARLAEIFAKLRKRDLDLSPILFFQPKLRSPAALTDNGLLRLTGFFKTKPEQISFDMLFQPVESDWRLFGLAVDVAPPNSPEEEPSASAPRERPSSQNVENSVQPAASQDSAPINAMARDQVEPKPAFTPEKASLPLPIQRPAQPVEQPIQQSANTTANDTQEDQADDDTGWTLWGN